MSFGISRGSDSTRTIVSSSRTRPASAVASCPVLSDRLKRRPLNRQQMVVASFEQLHLGHLPSVLMAR